MCLRKLLFFHYCPVTETICLCFTQDLQFVIKLSFSDLWFLRNKKSKMSIMDVIEYFYPFCKGMECLKDSKFLIIMDSFDCYQAPLPWKVSHLHTHLSPIHNYLRNHVKLIINSTLLTT